MESGAVDPTWARHSTREIPCPPTKKTMSIENFNLSSPYFSYSGINASISIIEGAGVEKFIVTINNTSFKKRLESQYFISNNNVSFLGLSKMLAHEIKNPLSGIKGSAQLLSVEVDKDKKELTDIIIQETDRIDNIINKIECLFSNDLKVFRKPCDSWNPGSARTTRKLHFCVLYFYTLSSNFSFQN